VKNRSDVVVIIRDVQQMSRLCLKAATGGLERYISSLELAINLDL
jgi:hypothetical protein